MSYDTTSEHGMEPCCSDKSCDACKCKVIDDERSTERALREERVLTRDEARAQVCRSIAEMLVQSIEATEEELKKAIDAGQVGNAEKTGALIVQAAREMREMMIATARKLDRPRILRPERSMKVIR